LPQHSQELNRVHISSLNHILVYNEGNLFIEAIS
jgi:hypothetical protein